MAMRVAMILIVLFAALAAVAWPQTEWSGRAHVLDGDSLYVGDAEVRLYGIDSPEHGQRCERTGGGSWACDEAAKARLMHLAQDRVVACVPEGHDRHDRVIAMCWVDGIDLGGQLVTEGLAWAYRRYSMEYAAAEDAARAEGRGVWANGARPLAPWEFRAAQRRTGAAIR